MKPPYSGARFNPLPSIEKKCFGKPCYSKKLAETTRNRRQQDAGEKLRIYHCHTCNFWHMAHTTPHRNSNIHL